GIEARRARAGGVSKQGELSSRLRAWPHRGGLSRGRLVSLVYTRSIGANHSRPLDQWASGRRVCVGGKFDERRGGGEWRRVGHYSGGCGIDSSPILRVAIPQIDQERFSEQGLRGAGPCRQAKIFIQCWPTWCCWFISALSRLSCWGSS